MFGDSDPASNHRVVSQPALSKSFSARIEAQDEVTAYKEKHILRDISGSASSGELLAIMGPSGCGKTTLLNVLAARAPSGGKAFAKLEGQVLVNGLPRHDEAFRSMSAYLLQDDKLFPHLTKNEFVNAIIEELGLMNAKNTAIGNEKVRGVSGGERRRASIAVQLITNPSVLLLDEPTSGLDSFQAQSVMEAMKALALNNRLVIAVIHQPRSSIYDMFDRLLLLSEGMVMYFGSSQNAVHYFNSMGHACPKNFNPSDYFLDVLSPDNRSPELESNAKARIENLSKVWLENNPLREAEDVTISGRILEHKHPFDLRRLKQNFFVLCWRSLAEQSRDKLSLIIKHILAIIFGLLIGGIYSGTHHDQRGIQNRVGILFLIVINQTFNPLFSVLSVFPKEKIIIYRERSAHAYNTFSYFLAKYFVEIPLNMSPTILFGIIIFWLTELNPKTFGYFLLILGYHNVVAITLGLCVGSVASTVESATAIGVPIVIILVLFGGFYINVDALPIVANWIPYLSILRWTYEALLINEFAGLEFSCHDAASEKSCIRQGEEVLKGLSFNESDPNPAVFGMSMVLVGLIVVLLLSLELSRMKYIPLGFHGRNFRT